MTYIELHAKSAFSFLEAAALPETLAERAAALGQRALALDRRAASRVYPRLEASWAALGRARQFEQTLRRELTERPEDADTRLALAAHLAARGEVETALAELEEAAKRPKTLVGWVSAAVEGEVAALPPEEQRSFLDALGLPEPALHRVIRDAYALLGLASFFTVGEDEVRAWTIIAGAPAVDAASAIHSDIARGFIRAEVVGWAELLEAGSLAEARKRALLRLEGKDYPVQDGEVCHFRFNVGR